MKSTFIVSCCRCRFAQQSKNPVTDVLRDSLAGRQKHGRGNGRNACRQIRLQTHSGPDVVRPSGDAHCGRQLFFCAKVGDVPQPKVEEMKETAAKEKLGCRSSKRRSISAAPLSLKRMTRSSAIRYRIYRQDRPRAWAALALASSWADHYGAAAMYLRLNGLLPPTRAEEAGRNQEVTPNAPPE